MYISIWKSICTTDNNIFSLVSISTLIQSITSCIDKLPFLISLACMLCVVNIVTSPPGLSTLEMKNESYS